MSGATTTDFPLNGPVPASGHGRHGRRSLQNPLVMPWESHRNSEATGSNLSSSDARQAERSGQRKPLTSPSYVNSFEIEVEERLRDTAKRIFPDRSSYQDQWFNMKFKHIQDNYSPRRGTRSSLPKNRREVGARITYIAKTPKDMPGADHVRCDVFNLDLKDSFTVKQSLQQAQDDWNLSHGPDDLGNPPAFIRWVHLPANNMKWVRSVMPNVMATCWDNSSLHDPDWDQIAGQVFEREYWDHQCRSNKQNPLFSRTMEPFATCINVDLPVQSSHPSKGKVNVLAAFMPYLHWESSVAATYMRHVVKDVEQEIEGYSDPKAATAGSKRNENPVIDEGICQDEALLREYLLRKSFVHPRRTLDQFYYPFMVDTSQRDADQVIERYARDGHFDEEAHFDSEPPILMVDQCWVWAIDSNTIVTAFPKTWNGHNKYWDPLDLRRTILKAIRNPRHTHYLKSATEFARFVLRVSAVNILQPSKQIREQQKFLRYFEYAIAELRQRKIDTFTDSKLWWDPRQTLEEKLPTLNTIFHVQEEYDMLEETRDILEELQMIRELLDNQDSSLRQFEQAQKRFQTRAKVDQYNESKRNEREIGTFMIGRPAMEMRRSIIKRLTQKAEEVGADVKNQLGVKHQQAGMIEAQFTRLLSEQTHQQGIILMAFTAVTFIFLPLSTMAAIFGINTTNLGSGSMHMGTIFAIIAPTTIMCIFICFMITLNRQIRERFFGKSQALYAKVFSSDENERDGVSSSKDSAHRITADKPRARFATNPRKGPTSLYLGNKRPQINHDGGSTPLSTSMNSLTPSNSPSQPTMSVLRRDYRPSPNRAQRQSENRDTRFTRTSSQLWMEQDAPELSLSEGENSDSV